MGRGVCMTFRHRHRRQCRLIETAKVEQGKVEAGERRKEVVRRMSVQQPFRGESLGRCEFGAKNAIGRLMSSKTIAPSNGNPSK